MNRKARFRILQVSSRNSKLISEAIQFFVKIIASVPESRRRLLSGTKDTQTAKQEGLGVPEHREQCGRVPGAREGEVGQLAERGALRGPQLEAAAELRYSARSNSFERFAMFYEISGVKHS